MNEKNNDREKESLAAEEEQTVGPVLPLESSDESETDELPPESIPEEEGEQPKIVEPEVVEPEQESKARRFFRQVLRWVLGVLIVFGLGCLAAIFALYRPEVQKYQQVNGQLNEAKGQIATLESRIDELQPMETKNEALLAAQDEYELHIAVLDARVDVTNARLALAEDDIAQAQLALKNTGETLARIKALLPAAQGDVLTTMENRLELALSEIEDDPYAADSDLDVLATNLLQLDDSLFGSP